MNIVRDKPAIEPLSEVSWRRIEGAIFAELDRQDVAASAPVAQRTRPRSGLRRAPAWALAACAAAAAIVMFVAHEPAQLTESSRIVTADSPAQMLVGRATLTVAPESTLWVRGDDASGVQVTLEQGQVECAVAPRSQRAPFVVKAGDVRVEVVGTRFVVARDGASARVHVSKGMVHVFHDGERTEVGAGESWSAPAVAPDEPAAGAADEAASAPPAGRERVSAQELYERAARLEPQDPRAARALYRKLAEGSGAWSANALFALGRLELELGDAAAARTHLEAYLRRFPEGVNAPDARELLGR